MNKTVWYISKYFAPKSDSSLGGRGWLLMREMVRQGYKAVVITSDSNNLELLPELSKRQTIQKVEGVTLVWLKTLKYKVAKSPRRILSWFHFEWNLLFMQKSSIAPPDVIVVSTLSLLSIFNGFLLRRKYKCRLVFEIRDIWPLTLVEEGGFSRKNPVILGLQFVERLGYKYSDIIVGTMPNLGAHVTQVLGYERPVYCVPMGVLKKDNYDEVELSPEYTKKYLSSHKFKVVHAGTIGITNALDTFFEVAKSMQHDDSVQFVIVGDGALKESYMTKYSELSNLVFAPRIPKNKVQSALAKCDLLYFSVHTSKVWEYGQSLNKVIDYMRAGKPIVASYTGFPSMVNEAGCGTFIPASDAEALKDEILRYKSMDSQLKNNIGVSGSKWIYENRCYEKLASDYLSILFK